jgi:hypothetical protein
VQRAGFSSALIWLGRTSRDTPRRASRATASTCAARAAPGAQKSTTTGVCREPSMTN